MDPNEQRIAIAEACGWKIENYGPPGHETLYWRLRKPDGAIMEDGFTGEQHSRTVFCGMLPDYLNDLNAMHEAEKVLTDAQWGTYIVKLVRGPTFETHGLWEYDEDEVATIFKRDAAYRAECLIRTIGKWKEAANG